MADQLATSADLNALLQTTVDSTLATLLLECATGVVQDACGGQRIIQAVGDVEPVIGTTDNWLDLPQIPVTAVTSVVQDGTTLTVNTDYKVFGNRLWRKFGWQTNYGWPYDGAYSYWGGYPPPSIISGYPYQEPSGIVVTYTHGIPSGDQRLQFARAVTLSLAATTLANPDGAQSVRIDDYSASFTAMQNMLTDAMRRRLRKTYGRRAALVRVG